MNCDKLCFYDVPGKALFPCDAQNVALSLIREEIATVLEPCKTAAEAKAAAQAYAAAHIFWGSKSYKWIYSDKNNSNTLQAPWMELSKARTHTSYFIVYSLALTITENKFSMQIDVRSVSVLFEGVN